MRKLVYRVVIFVLMVTMVLTGCSDNKEKDGGKKEAPTKTTELTLRQAADKYKMLIGAAVEPDYLDEPEYAEILREQYNFVTPENRMKWGFIHPKKDKYDFAGADKIVDFAAKHNMKVRGHTLVWHIENPGWLTETDWTKEQALEILEDHIKTVVGHYKGKVYAWDVVNEVLDAFALRDTLWLKAIGPEYIEKAFIWAHEADPDAKLYINDFFIEEKGVKSDYLYKFVKELLDKKIPIDGIGFQLHIDMENPMDIARINENIKRFTDLGLEVDFTEVDIRITGMDTDEMLQKQADMYSELMNLALSYDKVRAFTMWGITDKYSWVRATYPEAGYAHIYDKNYKPKPAYNALLDVLKKGPVIIDYEKQRMEALKSRNISPPFEAVQASKVPIIDGKVGNDEWKDAIIYPFVYNQMNTEDMRPPEDSGDLYGNWRLMYSKNKIYGLVLREDDVTMTDQVTNYVNDCVELFTELNGEGNQFRTIIGSDWEFNPAQGERKAVWSKDGKVLEFVLELASEQDLAGISMGWNIALTDSDETTESRKFQLYPVNGANQSWQGKDLGSLKFAGGTPKDSQKEYILAPFKARQAIKPPVIDGSEDPGVWDNAVKYRFGYNLVNPKDQTFPKDQKDIYGEWKLLFDKNTIYGFIKRMDDKTVKNNKTAGENDNIEVSLRQDDEIILLRTVVGSDWENNPLKGNVKAVWSEDGSVLEFSIEYPGDDLTGKTIGWNISLTDNDGGENSKAKYRLFPIPGPVGDTQQSFLGELTFEK
jgi:GH35 family endo-1,4-beta-xylanase